MFITVTQSGSEPCVTTHKTNVPTWHTVLCWSTFQMFCNQDSPRLTKCTPFSILLKYRNFLLRHRSWSNVLLHMYAQSRWQDCQQEADKYIEIIHVIFFGSSIILMILINFGSSVFFSIAINFFCHLIILIIFGSSIILIFFLGLSILIS